MKSISYYAAEMTLHDSREVSPSLQTIRKHFGFDHWIVGEHSWGPRKEYPTNNEVNRIVGADLFSYSSISVNLFTTWNLTLIQIH